MPWGPEDWEGWLVGDEPISYCEPAHVRALRRILSRMPDRGSKTVARLGDDRVPRLAFLEDLFEMVVDCSSLDETRTLRKLDIVVAIDSIRGPRLSDVDRALEQIRDRLVEGGVLLASFPAPVKRERPFVMRLGRLGREEEALPLHELELQYRMRRAGYRGLRVRRFRAGGDPPDSILCMAVRRASN